jgi:hypothetical protein
MLGDIRDRAARHRPCVLEHLNKREACLFFSQASMQAMAAKKAFSAYFRSRCDPTPRVEF